MKKLFEPATVGKLSLKNRLVRSATHEYAFDNETGAFAPRMLPLYEKLAANGIAAIITGMVGVDENSRASSLMVKAYGETFVPGMTKLAECVHNHGSRLIVQISHCGQRAGQIDNGGPARGPSDAEDETGKKIAVAMTREDIRSVVASFARTAVRCKEAGADAVQMHGAHGYLLSEFLSPFFNKRTDEYGGPIENRARIVFEVLDAIRAAVGPDYPIWIKINCKDGTPPSIRPEEFQWVCEELDRRGIDAIEISGTVPVNGKPMSTPVIKTEDDEGFFGREALGVAEKVSASVVSVCGYRTPAVMEQWLNKGKLAALSLCRPLISEPDLVGRWERGETKKGRCISCSQCFNPELRCIPFEK